jgi:hypothetical protein
LTRKAAALFEKQEGRRAAKRYVEHGAQSAYRRQRMLSKLDDLKPLIDQWLAGEPRLLTETL